MGKRVKNSFSVTICAKAERIQMTMSLPQAMKLLPLDSKSSCVREVTLDPGNDCPGVVYCPGFMRTGP